MVAQLDKVSSWLAIFEIVFSVRSCQEFSLVAKNKNGEKVFLQPGLIVNEFLDFVVGRFSWEMGRANFHSFICAFD